VSAANYEKEDFNLLKEEWIRNAEEKLARIPEEIRNSDDEPEPAGTDTMTVGKNNEETTETAEETQDTEEVQPYDYADKDEGDDSSESNIKDEPIGQ